MNAMDIILIVAAAVAAIVAGIYFLNKWAAKRMTGQQEIIDRTRTVTTIYVIDKKKDKAANVNLPKAAASQMPKVYKFIKMPFVKAKIGPQIVTLMCDGKVFKALPVKKSVKVGLAGIYIVDMVGMKTEKEMKEQKKQKAGGAKKDGRNSAPDNGKKSAFAGIAARFKK